MSDAYEAQGFGETAIGFGERPAVLVVDFQLGFTSADQPLGGSPLVDSAVENASRLLMAARAAGVPVLQTYVGHRRGGDGATADALFWKIPAVREAFDDGSEATKLDPRIHDPDHDVTVRKIAPSIFFGTPAIQFLTRHQIDTTIIVGCNTSGCVRASVVDAFSYGYRVIVPRDACGDVEEGPHEQSLTDVGRRYADVMTTNAVIDWVAR
ncbi:MAG: isochorismatase family protein [Pseudomonadota bacterium]